MRTNGEAKPTTRPNYIGFVCIEDGYYGYGDPERRRVEARCLWRPLIIHEIPVRLPERSDGLCAGSCKVQEK